MTFTTRQIIGLDPIPQRVHGCHNRKPLQGRVLVQNGWHQVAPVIGGGLTRAPRMVELDDPMSKDCQYIRENKDDPACSGCKWRAQG